VTPNPGMGPPVRRFLSNYFDLLFDTLITKTIGHRQVFHFPTYPIHSVLTKALVPAAEAEAEAVDPETEANAARQLLGVGYL